MGIAAILVHAHADAACEPRLRLAAGLADQLEAKLIGIAAEMFEPPPGPVPRAPEGPSLIEAVDLDIRAELEAAEARFRRVCGQVRKGVEWRAVVGGPRRVIAAHSRAAELVVSCPDGPDRDFIDRNASTADLAMACGRPVLAGPADADHLNIDRIVLAWKDTREARRALGDSMPLLERASQVLVVAAPEGGREEEAAFAVADVAETIRRHGGRASVRLLPEVKSPAEAILEAAVNFNAELIVAGAYGRSRMQEWVFGGVTRELLRQEAKFVLLSH